MKEKIQEIFDRYLFSGKDINLNQNIEEIINQVEDKVIKENVIVNSVSFITDLLHLERLDYLEKLNNDDLFKKTRTELISELDFSEDFEHFIYNKSINVEFIRYLEHGSLKIMLLNENQKEYLKQKNYKINHVKILKHKKIKCIYCEGKHSNLNPNSNEYCVNNDLFDCDLNFNNISYFLQSMAMICLNDSYLDYKDSEKLLEML